mgnify:FL=1|tara:strand:+ start:97 stop:336 length:240 start_codon:yes stop_codon:yes gene_type:complete
MNSNNKLPLRVDMLKNSKDIGVPDYIKISGDYYEMYSNTSCAKYLSLSQHYLRVAEEVGLCQIHENVTQEFFLGDSLTK